MNTASHLPLRALSATEIVTRLTELNGAVPQGWRLIDGALEKTFRFADFYRTMAFVNALAFIAHQQDHHPDLQLGYGHCTVRWNTHDVKGISAKDFACATEVDALDA